jgi:hypothetical protein
MAYIWIKELGHHFQFFHKIQNCEFILIIVIFNSYVLQAYTQILQHAFNQVNECEL